MSTAANFALNAALGVALTLIAVGLFVLLDRWHRRKAWRDAARYAADHMREVHGVERAPDGSWRKVQ